MKFILCGNLFQKNQINFGLNFSMFVPLKYYSSIKIIKDLCKFCRSVIFLIYNIIYISQLFDHFKIFKSVKKYHKQRNII